MLTTDELKKPPKAQRIELWKQRLPESVIELNQEGSAGFQLPFLQWRLLNRLRTDISRCGLNIKLWDFDGDEKYGCGVVQNPEQFMTCPHLKISLTMEPYYSQ